MFKNKMNYLIYNLKILSITNQQKNLFPTEHTQPPCWMLDPSQVNVVKCYKFDREMKGEGQRLSTRASPCNHSRYNDMQMHSITAKHGVKQNHEQFDNNLLQSKTIMCFPIINEVFTCI